MYVYTSLSQYVSAEGHGITSFPIQSPPPPGYPVHPHHSGTSFPAGGPVANRTVVPATGSPQPAVSDKCELTLPCDVHVRVQV